MQKKKQNNFYDEDRELLLSCMEKAIEGDFTQIDIAGFHDTALAQKYNAVLDAFLKANNNFVMRLNDSMTRIGDSSCVKEMIEQVNSQTESIGGMRDSSQELEDSIQNIQSAVQNIQSNAHSVIETSQSSLNDMEASVQIVDESARQVLAINEQVAVFREKAISINNIIDMVKKIASKSGLLALNASIEAARAGDAGRSFAVVATQIRDLSANTTASAENVVQYVGELMEGINTLSESIDMTAKSLKEGNESVHQSIENIGGMVERLDSMGNEIDHIYGEISTQSALTQNFVSSIDTIADSYDTLMKECAGTGEHLYRISRDIDRARSDMARHNSKITTLDWITVFEIDHLIFTWRIYNNLADFERLKITQLNNPAGCKFGKWMAEQTDTRITSSSEFKQAASLHEELHKYGCESWYAKDRGDRAEALEQFNRTYEVYGRFQKALVGLRRVLKSTGETEETDIKIFSM
ncbi:MAG: methyl-accepting chemotaxis protein [Bacillus sp. (in: Bacteria)]|nr:methyl-accepting chemotaxis protein [Bacillus sp. (in: firmicutes)]MCM1425540.1 methyl-accepting chemotaxis protein [Eubacterium sp.]